jgi:Ran GTPase-activating protein (RanGAP) involved in mRNA processing and transport
LISFIFIFPPSDGGRYDSGYNKMYNDGAWELAEALSENTGLRGLDLQRNEISDEGGEHVRALLAANAGLREVDMRSNMLAPETVAAFTETFGWGCTS